MWNRTQYDHACNEHTRRSVASQFWCTLRSCAIDQTSTHIDCSILMFDLDGGGGGYSGIYFIWNNVEISSCCRFYWENYATEAKKTTLQVLSQVSLWKQLPFSTSTLQFGVKVSSKNNVGTMLMKVYAELYCRWILIQCDIQACWEENLAICHKSFRAFLHSPFVLSGNYDFN